MTNTTQHTTNRPVQTLRDGAIKATIWARYGENGTFYSTEISRTYTDEAGKYHDSHSYSGSDLLKVARLSEKAYDAVAKLRAEDRQPEPAGDAQ